MSPYLRNVLFKRFHQLYSNVQAAGAKLPGDGWFDILFELSERLVQEINKIPTNEQYKFQAATVKEKGGKLSFVLNGFTPIMDVHIQHAIKESSKTCEWCGKEGKLRDGLNWTLCEEHYKSELEFHEVINRG